VEIFIEFLKNRITNEIFYEIKEVKNESDLKSDNDIEVILHFLAKIEQHIVLYETKQKVLKSNLVSLDEEIITSLQKVFLQVDDSLRLVKGKIREIFLSYSS
jgi:hypothetical protein